MPRNADARTILPAIEAALAAHGLRPRGGFQPQPDDGLPPLPDGAAVATVLLVGHAGPQMWQCFVAQRPPGDDPLDAWSRQAIGAVAAEFAAGAVFPFDGPPYWPFQRWAQRAEPVHPSPLGPLIHADYGLWHAYRGALLLPGRLALPRPAAQASPCESCVDKPCLSTCPVGAVAPGQYDVPACVGHVSGPDGDDCRQGGCLARRACPVGRDYVYEGPQAAFHMAAFLRNAAATG